MVFSPSYNILMKVGDDMNTNHKQILFNSKQIDITDDVIFKNGKPLVLSRSLLEDAIKNIDKGYQKIKELSESNNFLA